MAIMLTIKNEDEASLVCDALTEWGRCQRENADTWKAGTAKRQRCLDAARSAEDIRDRLRGPIESVSLLHPRPGLALLFDILSWSGMKEISGFGGRYESACRAMVLAGLEWLDAHPGSDPKFVGCNNIYGVVSENNKDANDLSNAVLSAEVVYDDGKPGTVRDSATGAMHQAAVSHVLYIRNNGWEKYVEMMKAPPTPAQPPRPA